MRSDVLAIASCFVCAPVSLAQTIDCAEDLGYPVENYRRGRNFTTIRYDDLDNDGDDDLIGVVLATPFRMVIARNDGNGVWTNRGQVPLPIIGTGLVGADFNGDGVRDYAVSQPSGAGGLIIVSGNADVSLGPTVAIPSGGPSGALLSGDADGDGDTDLFAVDPDAGVIRVILNDGQGGFTVAPDAPVTGVIERAEVGDLTGDGAADLVVFDPDAFTITVWTGDGAGGFSAGEPLAYDGAAADARGNDGVLIDWDTDGDLDLARLAPSEGVFSTRLLQILTNDGTGGLSETARITLTGRPQYLIEPADFDEDGDSDLAFVYSEQRHFGFVRGLGAIAVNDGTGGMDIVRVDARDAAGWCDADGDGDVDLFLSPSIRGAGIVEQTAPGIFRGPDRYQSEFALGVAVGEFTGDGFLDVVTVGESPTIDIWEGSASGELMLRFQLPPSDGGIPQEVLVADLDGNGLDDFVAGGLFQSGSLVVYVFDQPNEPRLAQADTSAGSISYLSLIDFDHDGDPDLLASASAGVSLFRNDGSGVFAAPELLIAAGRVEFAAGDLDGDGDVDIAIDEGPDLRLYENDGAGNFTEFATLGAFTSVNQVFLADTDQDGDLDVVTLSSSGGGILVYENRDDAEPRFDEPPLSLPVQTSIETLAVGDANGDGFPDLAVLMRSDPDFTEVFLNDGNGSFHPSRSIGDEQEVKDIVLGDLNADGKDDLVIADVKIGISVHLTSCPAPDPCGRADQAEPYTVLDLADLVAFVSAFVEGDARADITRDGLFDLADLVGFVTLFNAGCP